MTQNEVDIIKNAVLDATEAYVDARLGTAAFVKTQIGVVTSSYRDNTSKKWIHSVKCNTTSNTSGIVYNNVLSVNNIRFGNGKVVFLVAPNAQFSNQFILGQLDVTPFDLVGGSISIGGSDPYSNPNFRVDANGAVTIKYGSLNINNKFIVDTEGALDATSGKIGGFEITDTSLGDEIGSTNCIGMIKGDKLFAWHPNGHTYVYYYGIRQVNGNITITNGGSTMTINHADIYASDKGSNVVWWSQYSPSDKRLKKDIIDLDLETSKKFINSLSPKQYEFIPNKTRNLTKGKRYGFIAQDVEKITGKDFNIAYDDDDKYKHLNYSDIIAPLVKVVQNQQKEIENLKSKLGVK